MPLPTTDTPTILFSNTTLVRDEAGALAVYVGAEKMLGAINIQVAPNGALVLAVPMERVRLAEIKPAERVSENVLEFKNFRKAQAELVPDITPQYVSSVDITTPQTDGDVS
jgi:hypothetical protein